MSKCARSCRAPDGAGRTGTPCWVAHDNSHSGSCKLLSHLFGSFSVVASITEFWPQFGAACSPYRTWTSGGDEPTLWCDTKSNQRRFITMAQFISFDATRHFSPAASLAALGVHLAQIDLFGPVRDTVKIVQKTVKHTPCDKLYDALISILAGAHGLVEINTRLRSDPAVQAAFGRSACADQSVVQDTLNACTAEQVTQMDQALTTIYRQHSQGYAHDYKSAWQILDADLTGLPCGKKAAFASKGYFPQQRYRRGRQLGRVLATRYHEIVVDQLFNGTTYLRTALRGLITATERILDLDEAKRAQTIVRIDAGGGSVGEINWLLSRGYQVHAKDYSGQRAQKLALSVSR